MIDTANDECTYLLKRAAEHKALAESCGDPRHEALHEQFVTLYRQRAAACLADDTHPSGAEIPGTRNLDLGLVV